LYKVAIGIKANTAIGEAITYKLTRNGAFLVLGGLPIDPVRMIHASHHRLGDFTAMPDPETAS
jgi:hypothetical protein